MKIQGVQGVDVFIMNFENRKIFINEIFERIIKIVVVQFILK